MSEQNSSYQQQAYDYLKSQIINLGVKPGEYVTDSEIASRLKISRTPVREAFLRLEKEGLLVNEARRGWKVYTLSLQDIHEIFDIKEAIEGMIACKAAYCKDEGLRTSLREAMQELRLAAGSEDPGLWLESDLRVHEILYQMAGNERARRTINNLNDQWHRVRIGFAALQERTQRSTEEHALFIESILSGDGDEAERRMRAHLNKVRQELVNLLVRMVLPFVEEGV